MSGLDDLPDELFYAVMYYLSYEEILKLCNVYKRSRLLCETPIFWQTKIESINPHTTGTLSNLSVERLKNIYKLISRWGQVCTCGANLWGNLGVNDLNKRSVPTTVQYPLNNVAGISAGASHTAFVTNQGEIYTFGYNFSGQLGIGNTDNKKIPTLVPGFNNVMMVSCGGYHTAFITYTGEMYTFGDNSYGQLGHGDTQRRDVPTRVSGYDNVVYISGGRNHTAFITSEGGIYMFGINGSGQLGLNDKNNRLNPTKIVNFDDIRQVSCGIHHSAFINSRGEVYTFGTNVSGCLGLNLVDETVVLRPRLIENFTDVHQILCGITDTGFIRGKNDVYMCGSNTDGALGLPNKLNRHIPTKIPNFSALRISCNHHTVFITPKREIYVCGTGCHGELGLGYIGYQVITKPTPIFQLSQVYDVSCGDNHTVFLVGKI